MIYVNNCVTRVYPHKKKTITSCSVAEKFRKVNFPSHDRIRHLNHMWSLIVPSTKVTNLPFWKFEFSQERRLPQHDRERGAGMVQTGMNYQAVADHFNVSRITISRLMIRPLQTSRTNDRSRSDRPRVTSQRQDRHISLIHIRNRMITLRTLPVEHLVWQTSEFRVRLFAEDYVNLDSELGVR